MSSASIQDTKPETPLGDPSRLTSPPDLSTNALNTLRDSLLSFPEGSYDHLDTMEKLAKLHLARFEAAVQFPSGDLNEAIDLRREICRLCSLPGLQHLRAVHSFCEVLQFRCYRQAPRDNFIPTKQSETPSPADLDELIALLGKTFPTCPVDHPFFIPFLSMLGSALLRREDLDDIQESVRLFRRGLSLCLRKCESRYLLLVNQAEALSRLIGPTGPQGAKPELEEAVNVWQEIADHFADSRAARNQALIQAGECLEMLCEPPLCDTSRLADLRSVAEQILEHFPSNTLGLRFLGVVQEQTENSHSRSSAQVEAIGPIIGPALLMTPWDTSAGPKRTVLRMTDAENTEDSILLTRQEVQKGRSRPHLVHLAFLLEKRVRSHHSQDLNNLSEAFELCQEIDDPTIGLLVQVSWFQKCGEVKHLDNAIADDHSAAAGELRHVSLLAEALHERYVWGGEISDLERAISLLKGAQVHVPGRRESNVPNGAFLGELYALGMCLNTRYTCLGTVEDLEESLRISTSVNLADAYLYQYERFGRAEDLESAAKCKYSKEKHMDTSEHCYVDIRQRITLCRVLLAQHEQKPDQSLLERAMLVLGDAFICCGQGHILYPILCHHQASILMASSKNDLNIVEAAIVAEEQALNHCSPNSIHRPHFMASLGELWFQKYDLTGQLADFLAGIESLDSALARLKQSNPSWGKYSYILGHALEKHAKIDPRGKISDAMVSFRNAALSPAVSRKIQLAAAVSWAHIAEYLGLHEALEAYAISLAAFSDIAWIGLDVRDRHNAVTSSTTDLASSAATCAIRFGALEKAVEFVEHGRAVFWQQAMRLRSPTEELMDTEPELATRLTELARDINISSFNTRSTDDTIARSEFLAREEPKRRKLVSEWDGLVERVRNIPGFEDFLKPLQYKKLAAAAKNTIVVTLCAADKTCHAIVLSETSPKCVELPLMTKRTAQKYTADLQFTLKRANRQFRGDMEHHRHLLSKSSSTPHPESILTHILSKLWEDVVKPVLDFLGLEKSENPPRLTWCPVGVLALLPIHAAGVYQGPHQNSISDYVISSYTPALTNILPQKLSSLDNHKFLMVGQAASPGQAPLPNTTLELNEIIKVIDTNTGSVAYSVLKDDQAKRTPVLTEMARSNLVHLACHGTSRENSLNSAVILQDGSLDVETMMRTPFSDARLVFLSACQTAQLNSSEPDESIHIASAMLFSGFKSVVATMWSIGDADAPIIAKTFYQHLSKSGTVEYSDAAVALHKSVKEFRARGASVLSWAPFIHLGI